MKTRVSKHYIITSGHYVYYVEVWREDLRHWEQGRYVFGDASAREEGRMVADPPEWRMWPQVEYPFKTTDESEARRVAMEVSQGLKPDPWTVVEYSDGVEFRAAT